MLRHLLQQNKDWAARQVERDAGYFDRLVHQQSPKYLWIGCADSRVPANVITDLPPGEVFVHRNIANLVHHADINCQSVMQFAVEVLKVQHIIVCGHYGCGGIRAAMERSPGGLVDHWLQPIRDIARLHRDELDAIASVSDRYDRLCELSVEAQARRVLEDPIVRDALDRGQDIHVHGWAYRLTNGHINCIADDLRRLEV
ncbi:carbonic anhydrase [Amorphus orientalis]|uniref:Carbonic anhydrase n=1 Tax=Amorphus orientalis TaxID=649198 RepID=A0AAE4AUQ5_9HYPH|nr:carbonic anhydrase [Amorphus orientalis]MDQ0317670.1 carbonic anhydrase [Amorphus orientalis]